MKKLLPVLILATAAVLAFTAYYFISRPKKVHYHAGFVVWVDGKKQDFSKPEYMSLVPCGGPEKPQFAQLEKAHLHDLEGTVAHVHRDNALWTDLFKNLNFSIPSSKPLVGYLNGKKVDDPLGQKIQPYDSLVLLIGANPDIKAALRQAVTTANIKSVEKKSESCGS